MRAHTTAMPCSHAYNTAPCETCMMELETQRAVLFLCFFVPIGAVIFDGKVRSVGDGRYEAYMIPPYKANHASFLELLPNGQLSMAWFSGTAEGADKCSIVVAQLPPNGTQWSAAALVSRRDGYSNQNPVLFYDSKTQILNLFHSQQPVNQGEHDAKVWHLESMNMGVNWTSPVELLKDDGAFDRNRIIPSLDGGLIFPIYYSVAGISNQVSAMELSSDHTNWKAYKVDHSNYLIQPSVIRPIPNKSFLLSFFRDKRSKHLYSSTSTDEGKSWTEPEKTSLPNNDAAIQSTVLANGHVALVYNPTTGPRNPIRISISLDGGSTWTYSKDLENSSSHDVEFSYPSVLQSPDGYIHVSYTYNRDTIKYVKFMESWIHS